MTGAIGLDVQDSRTAIAMLEWGAGTVRMGMVGDGRRMLVPHAWTGSLWGSAAAEVILDNLDPEAFSAAEQLFAWRQSPWSTEFLHGLYRRLFSYLGQTPPTSSHGHQVCLCTDAEAGTGPGVSPGTLQQRFESAGLTEVIQVEPADALVCRWLADPAVTPQSGAVLALACGEVSTAIALYQVQWTGQTPAVTPRGTSRVGVGSAAWCADLAAEVLSRCREGVPRTSLLPLLDGVLEFGALLRAQPSGTEIEWAGPLSERMFIPLRVTREYLRGRPEIAGVARVVREGAERALALAGSARPVAILVGGPGAIWPFIPDAVASLGSVWQSGEPEADLAAGAAWWVNLRSVFTSSQGGQVAALFDGGALAPAGQRPGIPSGPLDLPEPVASPDTREMPPWERDLEEVSPSGRDLEDLEEMPPWERDR